MNFKVQQDIMICFFIFEIDVCGSELKGLVSWAGNFFSAVIGGATLPTDTFPQVIIATVNINQNDTPRESMQLFLGGVIQLVADSLDVHAMSFTGSMQVKSRNSEASVATITIVSNWMMNHHCQWRWVSVRGALLEGS